MYHPVRLALELPGLAAAGPVTARRKALHDLLAVAGTAERSGVGALWLSGDTAGADRAADPVTLAGGLATRTSSLQVGIRAALVGGRHPAVLARDVTTLDLLSAGRAALLLVVDDSGNGTGGPWVDEGPAAALAEAATVCRLVFTDPEPRWSGRIFRVSGAVNRPGPFRGTGPPFLVDLDVLAGETQAGEARADGALERCLPFVDGTVTTGTTPETVSRHRALLDTAARDTGLDRRSLLWRGRLPAGDTAPVELAGALYEAGADGFIVQLGEAGPDGTAASPLPAPDEVGTLVRALRAVMAAWTQ